MVAVLTEQVIHVAAAWEYRTAWGHLNISFT